MSMGLKQYNKHFRDRIVDQLWNQVEEHIGSYLRDQLRAQLRDQLWAQLGDQLWELSFGISLGVCINSF